MKKKNICCVDNFSIIVPYRELEKLLDMDEQYAAMQLLYRELLEKVAVMDRYL